MENIKEYIDKNNISVDMRIPDISVVPAEFLLDLPISTFVDKNVNDSEKNDISLIKI